MRKALIVVATAVVVWTAFIPAMAQKLTAEEVVTKHLNSIAKEETRKVLKNQVATGLVDYKILRAGGAGANGKIVFASEGSKSLVGMTFPIPSYPSETIVYDGSKLKVGFVSNNVRSQIGDYLYKYDEIIKEGLFGGTLTTAWPLHDVAGRKAKLAYEGTKKMDGRELHVVSYSKRGGSDVEIKLFFETTTFHHVRTEYRRTVSSQIGSAGVTSAGSGGFAPPPSGQGTSGARAADASASQRELRHVLIEEFADFKSVTGVTVPHSYRVYVMTDNARGTSEHEWKATFSDFFINQPLDPASFNTADR